MKTVKVSTDLSDQLREYLDAILEPPEKPKVEEIRSYANDPDSLQPERRQVVGDFLNQKFTEAVIEQKESLLVWEELDAWLAEASDPLRLEEFYAYLLVDLLPGITERAGSIAGKMVSEMPSVETLDKLREAFRSYIYGLYIACLCVCRCILEELLQDKLRDHPVPISLYRRPNGSMKGKIEAMIDHAVIAKILDNSGFDRAKRVLKRGNDAAHDGKASEKVAAKVLTDIQVLMSKYLLR